MAKKKLQLNGEIKGVSVKVTAGEENTKQYDLKFQLAHPPMDELDKMVGKPVLVTVELQQGEFGF